MKVKARAGLRVPREDNARRYIGEEPVEVPASAYYLRRLSEGDLVDAYAGTETSVADVVEPVKDVVTSTKGTQ
ncbi:DUF2635 domain-containing protein [Phytobacter diazotrophicus]|uniref:DUF2635 domain-containing protein n=1 Tax=Phytobacter diazotrophicus TaxID=395631 RepID=UPI001451B67D|nr:DUF2635 domain-containing protein [Phytobacter diazotrophicus]QJF16664.1 DUF2635 domain-containing protein [Phytobacter diazotrophicus]